ncbi:MAG: hypothetical protein JNG85_17990, partial [Spirochaetaceae bacterium]|nr:hypothetical protein [Spirochaetaceae bacterium]
MPLQTSPSFICLFLEPPGNEARELALFRRALFAGGGDASVLALPEAVPLAYAGARSARPGLASRRQALAGLWKDYETLAGRRSVFRGGEAGIVEREGFLFMELEPPLAAFAEAAETTLAALGYAPVLPGGDRLPGGLPPP